MNDHSTPPRRGNGGGDSEEDPHDDDQLIPFDRSGPEPGGKKPRHRDMTPAQRRRLLPGLLGWRYFRDTPGWPVLIALAVFLFLALVIFLLRQLAELYMGIFS
ncbi:hypothetical protein [Saccharopolyspora taberi]